MVLNFIEVFKTKLKHDTEINIIELSLKIPRYRNYCMIENTRGTARRNLGITGYWHKKQGFRHKNQGLDGKTGKRETAQNRGRRDKYYIANKTIASRYW